MQSPSNLKCSALPNASFICALGLSLALLPPMLPLRVSQNCPGSCARRKKVNKNKRKSDTGSKSPLQTHDRLLSCPEQLSGETTLPETNSPLTFPIHLYFKMQFSWAFHFFWAKQHWRLGLFGKIFPTRLFNPGLFFPWSGISKTNSCSLLISPQSQELF